jgi:hypothetical protein
VDIIQSENGDVKSFIIGNYFLLHDSCVGFEKLHLVENVEEEIYYWSGRFVLFVNGVFYNDFAALHHLYYSIEYGIVSNSLRLLNSLGYTKEEKILSEFWNESETLDWLPPPKTIFKDFRLLLPFEYINSKFSIGFLNYQEIARIGELKRVDIKVIDLKIKNHIGFFADNLKERHQLALTGGHDSRMLFYAFLTNAQNIEAVLYDHPKLTFSDLLGFKYLTQKFNICSRLVKKSLVSFIYYRKRQKQFDEYCQRSCKEVDRHFFGTGQLFSDEKRLLFRANVLSEIFRTKNYVRFNPNITCADDMIENLKKKYSFGIEKEKALRLWYDIRVRDSKVNEELKDWRKLFWLDQRSTGWVGYIDGAVQIANYEYINLYNSAVFFYLFQNYSEKLDVLQDFQEVFLRNNKSDLLEIPFNAPDNYFIRVKLLRNIVKYIVKITNF